jgi:protein-arginine kinase
MEETTDEFLMASNLYSDWPEGRAVIINPKKTVKILINKHEHLDITFIMEDVDFTLFI